MGLIALWQVLGGKSHMVNGENEAKLRDYLKSVTAELSRTRKQLQEAEAAAHEPIAIVGMGCRFAGGINSPQQLWEFVAAEGDAVGPFPEDRGWDLNALYDPDPSANGHSYVNQAAFLDDVAGFDADFFGITAREAMGMDPQQRLLLEVAWEAMERARITPEQMGSHTGVFIGSMDSGYLTRLARTPQSAEGYVLTGTSPSVASGRLAYVFGFEGPAITVDTACSSSLSSLHLAMHSLRRKECRMALVGGAAVYTSPEIFVDFCRQRGLAPDGRVKAFSATADGTNWSEGVGVLVAERLSDALDAGHQVLAVIRGSATNQDGASNGLTAPNELAQRRVIAGAMADAGVTSAEIDMVEAHGTGTPLGDPIEMRALLAEYGPGRPQDRPLHVGSVKTNLGHSAHVAGIASIIKVVQAMRHGEMPKSLHIDQLSEHIDWSSGALEPLTQARPWDTVSGARRAGVSAFGVSGTNVHIILEQPEETGQDLDFPVDEKTVEHRLPHPTLWPISAPATRALQDQADKLVSHIDASANLSPIDIGYSLATSRTSFRQRAVIVGDDQTGLLSGLGDMSRGVDSTRVVKGADNGGKMAFLFSGQGSQRIGMGSELARWQPVFREALEEVCSHMDGQLPRPLWEVILDDDPGLIDQTAYAQPALFAIEVALFRLMSSWGIRPDFVAGHSIGEVAAAHVAGVVGLEDACTLVTARGRLMQECAGGAMAVLQADLDDIAPLLDSSVSIAAINGPSSTVISGDVAAVDEAVTAMSAQGKLAKRLQVSGAFHSAHMDPMLEAFAEIVRKLTFHEPRIPVVSTVTGSRISGSEMSGAEYWVRQARQTVRFADAVCCLESSGADIFVELGPTSALCAAGTQNIQNPEVAFVPSMHANRGELETTANVLAHAYVRGHNVDWGAYFANGDPRQVDLPTYAFQHKRYWLDADDVTVPASTSGSINVKHGIIDTMLPVAGSRQQVWTGQLSTRSHPWLVDHAIGGNVLAPGAMFVEMALTAGNEVGCGQLAELTLHRPMIFDGDDSAVLQLVMYERDGDSQNRSYDVSIYSRPANAPHQEWTCHAAGVLVETSTKTFSDQTQWPPAASEAIEVSRFYERLSEAGYRYGPAFQAVKAMWSRGNEVFAEIVLPADIAISNLYGLHPVLLDGVLQSALARRLKDERSTPALPYIWTGVEFFDTQSTRLRAHIRWSDADSLSADLTDEHGNLVARIESLLTRELSDAADTDTSAHGGRWCYDVKWSRILDRHRTPRLAGQRYLVLSSQNSTQDSLVAEAIRALGEHGADVAHVVIDPMAVERDDLAALVGRELDKDERCDVLSLLALDETPHRELPLPVGTAATLALAQAVDALDAAGRLWVVTRGAVSTGASDPQARPVQAMVWGLGREIAFDQPNRWAGTIDMPELANEAVKGNLVRCLADSKGEDQIAIRAAGVYGRRLVRAEMTSDDEAEWRPHGTALITGGTGGLGSHVALWMARSGVEHLVLTSRRGPDAPGADELREEIAALGVGVSIVSCDMTDKTAVAQLLSDISREHPPLTTVVHAAGALQMLTSLADTDPQDFADCVAGKVTGAVHLDELLWDTTLDAFVMFSSITGVIGLGGQGAYAAGNAFLDQLAQQRRARGAAATAIAWGGWEGSGMVSDAHAGAYIDGIGIPMMDPKLAIATMSQAVGPDRTFLCIAALDWNRLAPEVTAMRTSPLLAELPEAQTALRSARAASRASGEPLQRRLAGASDDERYAIVAGLVAAETAAVMGLDTKDEVDPSKDLREAGFDSLTAMELRTRLAKATGLQLPPTLVFTHSTAEALTHFLINDLGTSQEDDA